jgi:hypothetical protein
MFSTDISGRGLDYPDVTHIIQFTLPSNGDDFVHRIGRTGRLGSAGTGILICSEWEKEKIYPKVFKKLPEPQKIECYPEDEIYLDIRKKILTTVITLPEDLYQGCWRTMFAAILNVKKVNKDEALQWLTGLFTEGMGKNCKLQINMKTAKMMKILGVKGIEFI